MVAISNNVQSVVDFIRLLAYKHINILGVSRRVGLTGSGSSMSTITFFVFFKHWNGLFYDTVFFSLLSIVLHALQCIYQ